MNTLSPITRLAGAILLAAVIGGCAHSHQPLSFASGGMAELTPNQTTWMSLSITR